MAARHNTAKFHKRSTGGGGGKTAAPTRKPSRALFVARRQYAELRDSAVESARQAEAAQAATALVRAELAEFGVNLEGVIADRDAFRAQTETQRSEILGLREREQDQRLRANKAIDDFARATAELKLARQTGERMLADVATVRADHAETAILLERERASVKKLQQTVTRLADMLDDAHEEIGERHEADDVSAARERACPPDTLG